MWRFINRFRCTSLKGFSSAQNAGGRRASLDSEQTVGKQEIDHQGKGKSRRETLRLSGAANWATRPHNPYLTVLWSRGRVKGAAVLAVRFELTWAFAQRVVMPSRLPISPRQHLNRQRAMATRKGKTRRFHIRSGPRTHDVHLPPTVHQRRYAIRIEQLRQFGMLKSLSRGQVVSVR